MNSGTTSFPPQLISAYRAARYRAFLPEKECVLRIDRFSAELKALMEQYECSSATLITACNPYSRVVDATTNHAAQTRLFTRLKMLSDIIFPTSAEDPLGEWPNEKGWLVLGVEAQQSCQLGIEFQQNAIVLMCADAIPRLRLLQE